MNRPPTLSSLRFFAAYGLLFLNVVPGVLFVGLAALPSPFVRLVSWATAAVPFAYCLAGFLLFSFYRETFPGKREFWRGCMAFGAPVLVLGLLLRYLGPNPVLAAAFALGFFCLLFPYLLPFFTRATRTRAWILLLASVAASALPAILLDNGLLALMRAWPDLLYRIGLSPQEFFRVNPLLHLGEFTFGMALARLYIPMTAGKSNLLLLIGLLTVPLLALSGMSIPDAFVASFAFLPVFALQLWGGSGERQWVSRWLEWKFFRLLGEASYSLALLHLPLFFAAQLARNAWFPTTNPLWLLLLMLVGSVPLSVLVFVFFEKPLRA